MGLPNHPCDKFSYWRTFTFSGDDCVESNRKIRFHSETGNGYVVYFNGIPLTTTAELTILTEGYHDYEFNQTYEYSVCGCPTSGGVDGWVKIRLETSECVGMKNFLVNFTGYEDIPTYILDLPDDLTPIDYYTSHRGEYMLMSAIDDPAACIAVPQVPELEDQKVFGRLADGTWLRFDPRLNLDENTLENPLIDGGKSNQLVSGKHPISTLACTP